MDIPMKVFRMIESWIAPDQAKAKGIIERTVEVMSRDGDKAGVEFLRSQNLTLDFYAQNPPFAVAAGLAYGSSGYMKTGRTLILLGLQHGNFSPPKIERALETWAEVERLNKA